MCKAVLFCLFVFCLGFWFKDFASLPEKTILKIINLIALGL